MKENKAQMRGIKYLWHNLEYILAAVFFVIMLVALFIQVFFRFVLNNPIGWTEELAVTCFVMMVYIGSIGATRNDEHMANVHIKDLLPVELNFDMNMHILSFDPGGCHPIVETHVQEHGMYILQGEGMYLMDDVWMGIKKDDFIWFGAYAAQCAYGVGTEPFTYIYSKDCNRDVVL